ncbi:MULTISPECIES: polysaccharide deacetylase family protein [Rhizobium/Agrobacterium group]|uniref:polysaccharide deacetylase family protein n=1 Tax=Rhizobium/Agrobacterium group TaxID=227290 RepID=UPI000B3FB022|nr:MULTISPECIES: polysaccharide deacetylase family protein [Rhizobium/Agrobacterium group]MCF1472718.1 polysaccharide deacetylase family protein [Allorhizobium ampelinum]MCF1481968.1 polysaccharide deacetylase family protein [Allorhizobium ampelinum]MVA52807.1 polysaccharide deacetylase family protein [Agrobacterium vitis]MVA62425.1 polysaccharide deacetylase family protein [Agrobacterium vitis]MVA70650.1 polysaccharide deacetylase family protein [Agrobacterium vitis]
MILRLLASISLALCLVGCASSKQTTQAGVPVAFAPVTKRPEPLKADDPVSMEPKNWSANGKDSQLAGRTLTVSNIGDIKLAPKEVILTFDDGPALTKTETILDTLDHYNVKATFMMVGEMAKAHPEIAQEVLRRGHSIGSHTYRHPNLKGMAFDQAMNEIMRGETAVKVAAHVDTVGFFRFPYLSDTHRLRSALAARGTVILDVDIDTKDYYKDTPNAVVDRTMVAFGAHQGGIILMHDIHKRTVTMLPRLLDRLSAEGYKVVTLHYNRIPTQLMAARSE